MADFGGISSAQWQDLAPAAGGIGRWVWDLETGQCELDDVSLALFGLMDEAGVPGPSHMAIGEFFAFVNPDDVARVQAAAEVSMRSGEPYTADFRITRPDGETAWIRGSGVLAMMDGERRALIGANIDITELRQTQEALELVAGEMAHKIGNLLSLVSGLYRMASRKAGSVAELDHAFLSRLGALSKVTRLSLDTEGNTMSARDLVSLVLAELEGSEQVSVRVDDVWLNPSAAQTVTLALNELLTNAVKHGALSEPDGGLEVAIISDRPNDRFTLSWKERVSFPVTPPGDSGSFGMTVLNRMTAATFRGTPRFDWRPDGLHFHCGWQLAQMEG